MIVKCPLCRQFQGGKDMVIRGEGDGTLTNHPAKQQVVDFLKNLVVDSLSLPPASKTPHTIDLLLEVGLMDVVISTPYLPACLPACLLMHGCEVNMLVVLLAENWITLLLLFPDGQQGK